MEIKKVAIACQGGGIHGAFTAGFLDSVLRTLERLPESKRPFKIVGLSGTSAGALNSFVTWGNLTHDHGGKDNIFFARYGLRHLWETFSVRRAGEWFTDDMVALAFILGRWGLDPKKVLPPNIYYMLPNMVLPVARVAEWAVSLFPFIEGQKTFLSPIRPEFLDFRQLLKVVGEGFLDTGGRLDTASRKKQLPRLFIGAININSGEFEAFDSWDTDPGENVTFESVMASGTLPEVRHAQRVGHRKGRYWDGLYSHNPPVSKFLEAMNEPDKPHEIWVVRINPQKRSQDPSSWDEIEDRRNELAGNLSLNQELGFIAQVNKWLGSKSSKLKSPISDSDKFEPVPVYSVSMPDVESEELRVPSKFKRTPAHIQHLRLIGMIQGNRFMDAWQKNEVIDWTKLGNNGEPEKHEAIDEIGKDLLIREIHKVRKEDEQLAKRCEEFKAA